MSFGFIEPSETTGVPKSKTLYFQVLLYAERHLSFPLPSWQFWMGLPDSMCGVVRPRDSRLCGQAVSVKVCASTAGLLAPHTSGALGLRVVCTLPTDERTLVVNHIRGNKHLAKNPFRFEDLTHLNPLRISRGYERLGH